MRTPEKPPKIFARLPSTVSDSIGHVISVKHRPAYTAGMTDTALA